MTERKWTPGKWTVGKVKPSLVYSEGHLSGWPVMHSDAVHGPNPAEHIANAHLIAAAPDLYDRLEEAILQLEYMQGKCPTGTTPAVIARGRATLAKARGET